MKKILLVDDDQDILVFLSKILKRAKYEVISAATAKEALRFAKGHRPDLIILDVLLPDMDGTDVAMNLAQDMDTQSIPVIFLTGLLPKEKQETVTSREIYITIAKPVSKEELLDAVNKALSGKFGKE